MSSSQASPQQQQQQQQGRHQKPQCREAGYADMLATRGIPCVPPPQQQQQTSQEVAFTREQIDLLVAQQRSDEEEMTTVLAQMVEVHRRRFEQALQQQQQRQQQLLPKQEDDTGKRRWSAERRGATPLATTTTTTTTLSTQSHRRNRKPSASSSSSPLPTRARAAGRGIIGQCHSGNPSHAHNLYQDTESRAATSAPPAPPPPSTLYARYEKVIHERDLLVGLLYKLKESGNQIIYRMYDTIKRQEEEKTQLVAVVERVCAEKAQITRQQQQQQHVSATTCDGSGGEKSKHMPIVDRRVVVVSGDVAGGSSLVEPLAESVESFTSMLQQVEQMRKECAKKENVIHELEALLQSSSQLLLDARARYVSAQRRCEGLEGCLDACSCGAARMMATPVSGHDEAEEVTGMEKGKTSKTMNGEKDEKHCDPEAVSARENASRMLLKRLCVQHELQSERTRGAGADNISNGDTNHHNSNGHYDKSRGLAAAAARVDSFCTGNVSSSGSRLKRTKDSVDSQVLLEVAACEVSRLQEALREEQHQRLRAEEACQQVAAASVASGELLDARVRRAEGAAMVAAAAATAVAAASAAAPPSPSRDFLPVTTRTTTVNELYSPARLSHGSLAERVQPRQQQQQEQLRPQGGVHCETLSFLRSFATNLSAGLREDAEDTGSAAATNSGGGGGRGPLSLSHSPQQQQQQQQQHVVPVPRTSAAIVVAGGWRPELSYRRASTGGNSGDDAEGVAAAAGSVGTAAAAAVLATSLAAAMEDIHATLTQQQQQHTEIFYSPLSIASATSSSRQQPLQQQSSSSHMGISGDDRPHTYGAETHSKSSNSLLVAAADGGDATATVVSSPPSFELHQTHPYHQGSNGTQVPSYGTTGTHMSSKNSTVAPSPSMVFTPTYATQTPSLSSQPKQHRRSSSSSSSTSLSPSSPKSHQETIEIQRALREKSAARQQALATEMAELERLQNDVMDVMQSLASEGEVDEAEGM